MWTFLPVLAQHQHQYALSLFFLPHVALLVQVRNLSLSGLTDTLREQI